jgi:hypothetical protein
MRAIAVVPINDQAVDDAGVDEYWRARNVRRRRIEINDARQWRCSASAITRDESEEVIET